MIEIGILDVLRTNNQDISISNFSFHDWVQGGVHILAFIIRYSTGHAVGQLQVTGTGQPTNWREKRQYQHALELRGFRDFRGVLGSAMLSKRSACHHSSRFAPQLSKSSSDLGIKRVYSTATDRTMA